MAGMDDWHVQAAPFIYPNAMADGLGCDSEHCRVVTDENDPSS